MKKKQRKQQEKQEKADNIFTNEKSSMNEYVKKDIIEVYNEIDNLKKEEINLIQKLSKQKNIL